MVEKSILSARIGARGSDSRSASEHVAVNGRTRGQLWRKHNQVIRCRAAVARSLPKWFVSLEAAQNPWTQVLQEIQQETGMRFHHAFPLKGSVSICLAALPVKQALAQLFGPEASFIFHYPPGVSGQLLVPGDVWVLGTVREGAAESPRQAKLDSYDRVLPAPEEPESLSKRSEAEAGLANPALYDPEVIAQLTEMAQDKDPGTRLQALSALTQTGNANETELQTAIDAALSDKDPSVRSAAFQTLASRGGPEAMGLLWQALEDPDPGVRMNMVAVERVTPGKEGEALCRGGAFRRG